MEVLVVLLSPVNFFFFNLSMLKDIDLMICKLFL